MFTDFVPVHFAMDDYGLLNFDGTPLYEFPHPDTAYSEWGTMNFMHSRGEVRSFLQSAANYWQMCIRDRDAERKAEVLSSHQRHHFVIHETHHGGHEQSVSAEHCSCLLFS